MTRILSELEVMLDPFEWSLERYHEAIKAGVLTEYDAVELIHGQLIKKMPIGEDHAGTVEGLANYFREIFGNKYRYRSENPVPILPKSEPEPDFVVANCTPKGKKIRHPKPKEIHLIIEVANSTLQYYRKVKGPIYAQAAIPEYWIINLKSRQVEVHQSPKTKDAIYGNVVSYEAGTVFNSPFVGEVNVDDLLPWVGEEE